MLILHHGIAFLVAKIMKNATQQTKDKSDVEIGKNALIASPADMEGSIR